MTNYTLLILLLLTCQLILIFLFWRFGINICCWLVNNSTRAYLAAYYALLSGENTPTQASRFCFLARLIWPIHRGSMTKDTSIFGGTNQIQGHTKLTQNETSQTHVILSNFHPPHLLAKLPLRILRLPVFLSCSPFYFILNIFITHIYTLPHHESLLLGWWSSQQVTSK